MDSGQFDNLTQAGIGTRRLLLLMAGSALGGVVARLGLGEDAEATAKKKRGERHDDHQRSGHVQAAGKKHKKHNNKGKNDHKPPKPIPPLPLECQNCGNCQMCDVNACVPDPDLDGVRCLDNPNDPGGECHVCNHGLCVRDPKRCCPGEKRCKDGSCIVPGEFTCCPEEKQCLRGGCVPKGKCCPDEKKCASGGCISIDMCCAGEKQCVEGGRCWPVDYCCVNTKPTCGDCENAVCNAGNWTCVASCTAEGDACCGGSCVSTICPPGQKFDNATCQCKDGCPAGQEKCADGTCCDGKCTAYTCCPAAQDYCNGTCCVPGHRCRINGRHGICCGPETVDCVVNDVWLGCYDPGYWVCGEHGPVRK